MILVPLILMAAPVNLDALEDPKPAVRYAASRKLTEQGPSVVPALIKALDSPKPLLREMSAHALAGFGQGEDPSPAFPAIAKLGQLLASDSVAPVRKSAARALGLIAREAPAAEKKKVATELAKGLKDPDPDTRSSVAMALAALDPTSADAAAELGAAMQRPEPEGSNLHQEACFRLEVMGKAAARGVPGLVHLMKSSDPDLRASAIDALKKLSPVVPEAKAALK